MKQQIVDIVKDYAEGNYHLDITEHDLHIAADRIVKLFATHIVSDSLQADIRNKLSPLSNLIAMIESDADTEWIKKQIPQAKISIEYLSNYCK